MNPTVEQQQAVLKRLARIEGQVRGLQKQIQAEADCEAVLTQMKAVRSAMDRAFFEMLACLVEGSMRDASSVEQSERAQEIRRLLAKYA